MEKMKMQQKNLLVHLLSGTGHKKSTATCLNLHQWSARKNECGKLVHHLCQSEWEQREGHDNPVAMYFCLCHQNYFNETQSETNDGSQETEGIDSAWDESDASLAQHGAVSNIEDGGTGTHKMASADPKVDAMESSVVGVRGDDHAEKNRENKDNIN